MSAAAWASARYFGFLRFGCGLPCNSPHHIEYFVNSIIDNSIINIPAIPSILDDSCFAKHGQLLGNISLPKSQVSFHVADTMFTIPQNIQDCKSHWVSQYLEYLSLLVERLCF